VVVFGLGTVGQAIIQAAKYVGAYPIIGIDIDSTKFKQARKFGATSCVNPNKIENLKKYLMTGEYALGYDYTFDCN
jgi:S-(hydroxymethyl)glutathione dehydrogenase/alcohol dehydrogenase